jgi:hypothetical protein
MKYFLILAFTYLIYYQGFGQNQKWICTNLKYSSDSIFYIEQNAFRTENEITEYETTIYLHQKKIPQEEIINLPINFGSIPIHNIYKITPNKSIYLITGREFIVENIEDSDLTFECPDSNYLAESQASSVNFSAYIISIENDSIWFKDFANTDFNNWYFTQYSSYWSNVDFPNSIEIESCLDLKNDSDYPFLVYDSIGKKIEFQYVTIDNSFQNNSTEESTIPKIYTINSCKFEFKDSTFVLIANDLKYFPPTESMSDTIAGKEFKIGNYLIKSEAIETTEDNGFGLVSTLNISYKVNNQSIVFYNDEEYEKENIDFTPNCKLQSDGSLIFCLQSISNEHRPGMCGSCTYNHFEFWRVTKVDKQLILSVENNIGTASLDYIFTDINGKNMEGDFFQSNDTLDEVENKFIEIDSTYWFNTNTFAFRLNNGNANYDVFIHFVRKKNKTIPIIEFGKINSELKED